jgi:hypothetical protein
MLSQAGFEDFDDTNHQNEDFDMDELNNLSAGIIGASVLDQLRGDIELTKSPTNFLGILDDRIKYLLQINYGNDDVIIKIKSAELEFYTNIAIEVAKHLSVSLDGLDLEPTIPSIYKRKIKSLYNFLIIYRFNNLMSVYYTYILNHRKDIAKELRPYTDKKDITVGNMRKQIKNFDDISILYNLSEIIDHLAVDDMKMDEFIDLLTTADGDSVDTYLSVECLTGCSIPKPLETYSSFVTNNDDLRSSLENELLFHLNSTFERK